MNFKIIAASRLHVADVTPRDGLQYLPKDIIVPVNVKVDLINKLARCGVSEVEVTSFVHPKLIPQLADAEDVCRQIEPYRDILFSALVPNQRGVDRVLRMEDEAGRALLHKFAVFTAASNAFCLKNIQCSQEQSIAMFEPVIEFAHGSHRPVRGYVSTIFWCPIEQRDIQPLEVVDVIQKLMAIGVDEIDLGDTTGHAAESSLRLLLETIRSRVPDLSFERSLALHLHDPRGMAFHYLRNAYDMGVRRFDGAMGAVGGCPAVPRAAANVSLQVIAQAIPNADIDLHALGEAQRLLAPYLPLK